MQRALVIPDSVTQAAGLPLPGVNRDRAMAWLMGQRPNISEISADRAFDNAVTDADVPFDRYFITWDPETGFTIWPGNWPPAVLPAGGNDAEAMRAATRRARQAVARIADAHGGANSPAAHAALAAASTDVIDQAQRSQRELGHDQAALLSVTLAEIQVMNHAWVRMDPARRSAHQVLWSKVAKLARPGYVAAPASLLTLAALQSSNGHTARCALYRALADQPGYPHATILAAAVRSRRPAGRYDPAMLPSPPSAAARRPGTGPGRPAGPGPELES